MSCEEYESSIVAYVLDELSEDEVTDCRAHLEVCERCRDVYDSYANLIDAIADDPKPIPTIADSADLSRALMQVCLVKHRAESPRQPLPQGLPTLILGSLLAFVVVAAVLALQTLGYIDIAAAVWSIGPTRVAAAVVIAITITSFLPIAVMAKRRPLNGMTFRR